MNADTELGYHYYTLGRVMFHLAKGGLRRVDLDQSDAMEIMDYRKGNEEEVLEVFHDVLIFMRNEGIISVSSYQEFDGGYCFNGVQLTANGLQLIQADPSKFDKSLQGSIAANTATPTSAATDVTVYGKWGEFIGSFVASAAKSLGGG